MIADFIRADYPYRPGAGYTGDSFGFRSQSYIGSPFHPGVDRSGTPSHIVMPFNGKLSWNDKPRSAWGSCARIVPCSGDHAEIQIAHTIRHDRSRASIHNHRYFQGDKLPIIAGNIGLSDGAHTHTELIIERTQDNYEYFSEQDTLIYSDGKIVDEKHILRHCSENGLDPDDIFERLQKQIALWSISEIWCSFIVRDMLPDYRTPHWGYGAVIIADTRRYLRL